MLLGASSADAGEDSGEESPPRGPSSTVSVLPSSGKLVRIVVLWLYVPRRCCGIRESQRSHLSDRVGSTEVPFLTVQSQPDRRASIPTGGSVAGGLSQAVAMPVGNGTHGLWCVTRCVLSCSVTSLREGGQSPALCRLHSPLHPVSR